MKQHTFKIYALFLLIFISSCDHHYVELSPSVAIIQGDVNGVIIKRNNKELIVYGNPQDRSFNSDILLLTHCRRDLIWAASSTVDNGTKAYIPIGEAEYLSDAESFWNDFTTSRFHDYDQQTTKYPTKSLGISNTVEGGDILDWEDLEIRVISAPGYSRGAVSYLSNIDGIKMAFTGDLIFGDGKIFDVYSLQDKVMDLNIMGYHGYASRIGTLIQSLQEVASHDPDILIPARGPIIHNPEDAINKLVSRLRRLYSNYLSTSAFYWYTGRDKQEQLAKKVLSQEMSVPWMPNAETRDDYPAWLVHDNNSVVIKSEDGSAFLIDCGNSFTYQGLLENTGILSHTEIEGIFITHYHDDHTDFIPKLIEKYNCPVYVTRELEDILINPGAYRLPAMTSEPIGNVVSVDDGHKINWKEFTFTFFYFPGQTILHDAMLVESGDEQVFFFGDSFSPSGMDDYCLQNRNIINYGRGYLYCIDFLRDIPASTWLLNQHIHKLFRFSHDQLDLMENRIIERKKILSELSPWGNINFMIDEQWARIYPYGISAEAGKSVDFSVIVMNHFNEEKDYHIKPGFTAKGYSITPESWDLTIPANQEDTVHFSLTIPLQINTELEIITADIRFDNWNLHEWCEGIIEFRR